MSNSLFDFAEVEAKTASPRTINEIVKDVLRADGSSCYAEMERHLIPPGVAGSRQFDQADAVNILLKHDSEHGGRLATIMVTTGMSKRLLWDRLYSVLRQVGFKMQHGRLVGLLEGPKNGKDKGDGQPDID